MGKACLQLDRPREAFETFRLGLNILRESLRHKPAEKEVRARFSTHLGRMAYRLTQHGRRLEAAACYLEQEPLWLDNAKELLEIVLDWGKLAEAVLLNSKEPCLGNLVEFELYLSQRDRLAAKMLSLSGLRTKPE